MGVKLAPVQRLQYFAADGITPSAGGKIFTYLAGTTTKTATYTTSTGTVANTNPIILNSAGRAPFGVWLTEGINYKFVQAPSTDTDPPVSPIFTEDYINGTNDLFAVSQWVSSGVTPSYQSINGFTLVGDQTAAFHIGRRIRITQTSGEVYCYIENSAFTTVTTITVRPTGSLDSGISAADLSFLLSSNHSIPLFPANRLPAEITHSAGGALTITVAPMVLDFRAVTPVGFLTESYLCSPLTLVVPSGATLGAVNAKKFRVIVGVMNNAGTPELFVMNAVLGNFLDESAVIATTAMSTASDSDSVPYSASARSLAFRILGYLDFTLTTAGTWDSNPTKNKSIFGAAPLNAAAGGSAHNASGQSISAATATKISLTTILYDTENAFASSAYTCKTPGVYQICAGAGYTVFVANTSAKLSIRKDGVSLRSANSFGEVLQDSFPTISAVVRLVPGEVLELWITMNIAQTLYSGDSATYFTVHRIA